MADMNLKIKIQGESKGAEDSLARINSALRGLENSSIKLNGLMAGLGISLSASGFAAFVKSGIDAADAMNDLADRSGIAIEKLAGLGYAVKIGDTSIESFVSASNKLSINIAKNAEDFAKLGISAQDPVDAFKQLADVFSSIEDPQQRAAFGAKALGKSYAEMAPLLMMGANGIQELINTGREHNPVTAEQARLAGEFNDKLEEMSNRSFGFRASFGVGVLEPMIYLGEAIDENINKFGLLEGAWRGFIDGYKNFALSGTGGGLSKELDQINVSIAEQKTLLADVRRGEAPGGSAREIAEYKKLNDLIDQRSQMLVKISTERREKDNNNPAAVAQQQISAFMQKGNAEESAALKSVAAARSANSADQSRLKSINDIISGLERGLEISTLSEDQQRKALELSNALKNARGDEVATITDLINAKYNQIDVDKRQSAQWQQLISDANDYADLRKSISDFERSNNISTDSMSGLIGQTQDLLSAGVIDDAQAKEQFDRLGKAFNVGFIEPAKEGTDQLSVYAEQAGRNMQDAFADFLFDPFQKGMDAMLDEFLVTVRKMAANAAAANIMDALLGKNENDSSNKDKGLLGDIMKGLSGGASKGLVSELSGYFNEGGSFKGNGPLSSYGTGAGSDFLSSLGDDVGGWFSDIGSWFSGLFSFENGGIMTSAGPVPLRKYAMGGIANSPQLAMFGEGSMNEAYVPLPDGRRIPVAMQGGDKSSNVYNVHVSINTPNADSFRKSERQIREQIQRSMVVA